MTTYFVSGRSDGLHTSFPLTLVLTLWRRCSYYPHFTDKETEAHRPTKVNDMLTITKPVRVRAKLKPEFAEFQTRGMFWFCSTCFPSFPDFTLNMRLSQAFLFWVTCSPGYRHLLLKGNVLPQSKHYISFYPIIMKYLNRERQNCVMTPYPVPR